jgi:pimeloyl-ACP methyl ester carboxylesterase
VRLDSFVYEGNPLSAHGIPFEDVVIEGALGPMPAWLVPGTGDTWAVMIHGKGANRRETLRILPVLAAMGLNCLAITYRNDEEAPDSHDRSYGYGRHEWEDLESAVRFVTARGARHIILYGFSMGGSISLAFLVKSSLAGVVTGLILDSPVLDLRETVAHGAAQAGIPRVVRAYGHQFVSRRYGFDWDEVDYLKRTASFEPPILLIHGDADGMVPVTTSDHLAAALPELVTYLRVPDAGHVLSWNVDHDRYETAVREFLSNLLPAMGVPAAGESRP